jgi:cyclic pyranopterin phosphate synthase
VGTTIAIRMVGAAEEPLINDYRRVGQEWVMRGKMLALPVLARSTGKGRVMSDRESFSHLDAQGKARMVDVSEKPITRRVAEASCRVLLSSRTVERLGDLPKGDALLVAKLAGIQGAKRAGELIPLAHPLRLDQVEVELTPDQEGVEIRSCVVVTDRTGAEMEALTACSLAALALYDMVKAVERDAVISDLRLEAKSGGRSGTFRRRR